MVYCQKCGTKNEDDAEFCKKCGASLTDTAKIRKKEHDDKCEEECAVGKRSPFAKFIWGLLIIFLAVALFFDFFIKGTDFESNIPRWLLINGNLWWLFGLVFILALIITGIRIMVKD
jgi:uncharacterized membrane protein YvbJ